MLGGATALAVAALLAADTWRQRRRQSQALARGVATGLRVAATALREQGVAVAGEALGASRDLERAVAQWDASLAEGHDISQVALVRRRMGNRVWERHRELSRGLDRAAGNLRVLVRRLVSSLEFEEELPGCLPLLLDDLAGILELLAEDLDDRGGDVVRLLQDYARRLDPVALHATSLSGAVAVAQLRTAVVDLLVGLGTPLQEARETLPALH